MFVRLLLLMTIVPALELYLLIKLGQWLGAFETVLIILFTGILGAALAKREGLAVLRQLKAEAKKGIPPADRLVEGLMVLIGGVLLMTPGVLTDLTGLMLIAAPSRRWLAPRIKAAVARRFFPNVRVKVGPGAGPADPAGRSKDEAPRSGGPEPEGRDVWSQYFGHPAE